MAHFARIDENNVVQQVVVVDDGVLADPDTGEETEALGAEYLNSLAIGEGNWLQTSYSSSFRGRFAGIGMVYLPDLDVFALPQPYPSWVLNQQSYEWEAPTPRPDEPYPFLWDEPTISWKLDLPTPEEIEDPELSALSASIRASWSADREAPGNADAGTLAGADQVAAITQTETDQ